MNKTSLEKDFDKALGTHGVKIQRKLDLAHSALSDKSAHPAAARAMKEAIAIADEHGIPFHARVTAVGNYVLPMENNYVPSSYFDTFGGLDPAKVAELTRVAEFSLSKEEPNGPEDDYDDSYDDSYDSSYDEDE